MKSKLEYIWLDGYKPTQSLRSKTRVEKDFSGKLEDCPMWSFDGSSTEQADGSASDCLLKPVAVYPDPDRKNGYLVMTEVLNADGTVIFYHSAPEGGTEATLAFCIREKKPYKLIDTESVAASTAAGMIREFVQRNAITSLNVAGPRESRCSGMYGFVLEALCLSLSGGGLS